MSAACPRAPWISYSYRNTDDWDGQGPERSPSCVFCMEPVRKNEHLYFSVERSIRNAVGGVAHWECPADPDFPDEIPSGFAKYCLNRFRARLPIHAPGTRTLAKLDPIDVNNVLSYNPDEPDLTRPAFLMFLAQQGQPKHDPRIMRHDTDHYMFEHLPASHPRQARDRAQLLRQARRQNALDRQDPDYIEGDD